jgi:thioredoxin 1
MGTTKIKVCLSFFAGLAGGIVLYHSVLLVRDHTTFDRKVQEEQHRLIATLQEENQQLYDELFQPRNTWSALPDDGILPYDGQADGRKMVDEARQKALQEKRILMVTFGANWCQDCRTLHRNLETAVVTAYTADLFHFVNVDVGKFNQNTVIANELGVSLKKGIPVAIFFDVNGQVIGTTNEGQLEPSRLYSSSQILKFVRDVAERSRILAPDAVEWANPD